MTRRHESIDFEQVTHLSFDCYGTLIDWERGILDALGRILARHEIRINENDLLEVFARLEAEVEQEHYRTYRDVLKEVVYRLGAEMGFQASLRDKLTLVESVSDWPAFDDSAEALRRIKSRFRLVVLSNIDDDLFEGSNRRLGDPFDMVITAQQIESYKPDSRNFVYLLDKLSITSDRLIHVAQSLYHDIGPARRMGIRTIWINRRVNRAGSGATPRASAEPDLTVSSLRALVRLLEQNDVLKPAS